MTAHAIDGGDVVAIVEALLISGTWLLVLRKKPAFEGRRRKLAFAALLIPSIAIVLDLILTAVMHFHASDSLGAAAWIIVVICTFVLGVGGLVCAIFAEGSPRAAGAIWSALSLGSALISIVGAGLAMSSNWAAL